MVPPSTYERNPLPAAQFSESTSKTRGSNIRSLPGASHLRSVDDALSLQMMESAADMNMAGPNGEDYLRLYPYGISRHQLERVIQTLMMPVIITKDLHSADAVLALRSQAKSHSKLKHIAKGSHIPISHSERRTPFPRSLGLCNASWIWTKIRGAVNLELFTNSGNDDELEALEEARLAVEQIVIPKGQPVELLPRSAKIRKNAARTGGALPT